MKILQGSFKKLADEINHTTGKIEQHDDERETSKDKDERREL